MVAKSITDIYYHCRLFDKVEISGNRAIQEFCTDAYAGHPQGCPNYGVKFGCPPSAKFFPDKYDMLWISVGRTKVQYDHPFITDGRNYPTTTMEKFLKWVKASNSTS
jgi:hypothetical protein